MNPLKRFLVCLLLPLSLGAQQADKSFDPVKSVTLRQGRNGTVVVTAPEGAHLKAAFMTVEKKGGPGQLKVGPLPPTTAQDEIGDGIWHGAVRIPLQGSGLSGVVTLAVTYQPCTEGEGGVCYPPTTRTMVIQASDIPGEKGADAKAEAPAENSQGDSKQVATEAPASMASNLTSTSVPTKVPATHDPLAWGLLVAFGWGLVAAFSPCVYPMIPITLAIVGAKGGSRVRGFFLSAVLVLGMAVTYMTLAVVTAKVGGVFGAFAQRPGFLIPVSLLFALFALSLFGAFEIRLPNSWQARLQTGPRSGWMGAFFMGLVLGPISAPCVGPYFGSVLTGISQQGDVAIGALKAFFFALGMGILFLAVGGFSAALPKSGDWLDRLKQIMGLVVLGFAAWNVRLISPLWLNFALWGFVMLAGAAVFGLFEAAEDLVTQFRKALAILLLVFGIVFGLRAVETFLGVELLPRGGGAAASPKAEASGWMEQDLEGALAKAKAEHKVVLVDVYAEWCAQCKELDEKTWPDATVKAWLQQHAVAVRIDTDARRKDLAEKLQIRSYPTVILLDGDGRELRRSLGFQKADTMKTWLEGN